MVSKKSHVMQTSYSLMYLLYMHIQMLRAELRRAEGELEDRCWAPPAGLQQWLQLTHEIENKAYLRKKQTADGQLQQARDAVSDRDKQGDGRKRERDRAIPSDGEERWWVKEMKHGCNGVRVVDVQKYISRD